MQLYLLINFPIKSQNRQKSSYEVASENHRYVGQCVSYIFMKSLENMFPNIPEQCQNLMRSSDFTWSKFVIFE